MSRVTDWTGINVLRIHSHVKVVRPNHAHHGQTGTVVRIKGTTVWLAVPNGQTVRASNRSLELLVAGG